MFPLWNVAIAPVLEAARAKRIVEIGALRGETTVQILESLAPGSELHVIDPEPEFDPVEHERAFPGRYVFHRALSLEVLPNLDAVDAALIDGDHNWYTVYHELRLLAEAAERAGQPLPVLVMHDVGWPYGRRDLYYAPDNIPEEFRQPYAHAGMRPGRRRLVPRGGLNPTMNNAEVEGGPRNGVMTALDDFLAEHARPVRMVELPIYFGLAIVVDTERLRDEPALATALDRLESAQGRYELLKLAEDVRLRAMIFQHNVFYQREDRLDRAVGRYLETTKAALLNEHYLDHEVRMAHLTERLIQRRQPDSSKLRDPVRHDAAAYRLLERHRRGPAGPDANAARSFLPYTAAGRPRLDRLEQCLDVVRGESVPGDLAECGTGRGGGAIFMRAYLAGHELPDRRVWVADRFRAAPEPDDAPTLTRAGIAAFRADLNLVRDGFARFDLLDERVRFLQGPMAATLVDAPIEQLALIRVGPEAADEAKAVLDHLYDRLSEGGFVLVDNGADAACREQIDAFLTERGITASLEVVDASAIAWRKTADGPAVKVKAQPKVGLPRAPLAPPAHAEALDLSVVVVFYNMHREAQRTLYSLSRAYQVGIDDVAYEVIVVENGSDPTQRLGAELVAGFGPEFRYVDIGDDADPSPVTALNRGIRMARGRNLALMIDGAHVLTPGVLRFGLAGLSTYAPAVVATQQWYLGPGQQGDAMDDGYDQAYEDRLFETIRWPFHGYRLFEIGHFVGDRDWLDGVWESNCIFVPRSVLEQIGCFDESFSMAGGGYANLELYERLGSSPDVTVVSILGEGSFHQVHGGNTTNQPDATERRSRVFGYSRHYAELRGRPFKGPGKPIHYVGRINSPAARRTKARRMSAETFTAAASTNDGPPEAPTPVPEELRTAFTESVWRSLPWDHTTWLGHRTRTAPTDLFAYQEVLASVRPDWVVETGTGDGGRALFLASMCELVGHGQVLSIDAEHAEDLPHHPRLHYLTGRAHDSTTVETVRETVGDGGRVVVVLGSCTDRYKTSLEFEAYGPLVPVGSYVVITDTIVNGHPVWPAFGPGPAEAVKQALSIRGEFVPDPTMEKYSLTFNPGGFLHRVR
jgi:cephalosporin hydroxylase